jgi:uncharacterized membrane protein
VSVSADPDHVAHENAILHAGRSAQLRVADRITTFVGSMPFVYVHLIWWAPWLLFLSGVDHDFSILTLIVSLEAILISTFVMISQNRQAERDEIRADLDFRTNVHADVLAEHLAAKLGIEIGEVHAEVARRVAEARSHDG